MNERDAAEPRPTVSDRVYGAIAAVAIVLALVFLVRGGEGDTGAAAASRATRITLEDPRPNAVIDQPLVVTFDARTALGPDGSETGAPRHVHADVNGQMVMPAPHSVRALGGTRYAWTLPRLPAGPATVRLYWSDAQHAPIPGATSEPVPVTLR